MQAAGFRNSLVPLASAILGRPLMKNVYAWIGGRAVLRPSGLEERAVLRPSGLEERAVLHPSGLVAALGFPFPLSLFCSVAELNFGFIFPCHFSPLVAWVPGKGLSHSLTPAQLRRKCQCRLVSDLKQLSTFLLGCASALKSAARVQLQLFSVASSLLLPHLLAAHYHVHFLGY